MTTWLTMPVLCQKDEEVGPWREAAAKAGLAFDVWARKRLQTAAASELSATLATPGKPTVAESFGGRLRVG